VGVVEEVGKKEKLAFSNLEDLWDILTCQEEHIVKKHEKKKGEKES
jgi:DNA-binding Xre family transcriptional regulator